MGSPTLTALQAHYVPRRLVAPLALALALAAVGAASAVLSGLVMGWILAAIMLWSAANLITKMRRRAPVLTLDAEGVHDHRVPRSVRWDQVASMRTVNRRVVLVKVPLLELVPRQPIPSEGRTLVGAVVRGEIAFVDARDDDRVMVDLHHLDVTPEAVLAAARALRG